MKGKSEIAWRDDLIKDQNEVISELRNELVEAKEKVNSSTNAHEAIERLKEAITQERQIHTETKWKLLEAEKELVERRSTIKQLIDEARSITIWSLLFNPKKKYIWMKILEKEVKN